MRCCTILASATAIAFATAASAEFTITDSYRHIVGGAADSFGFDFFEHEDVIPLGYDESFFDNAYTPGDHTWSGVATLTNIGPNLIDLRGFANGHTSIESGEITALAEVSLTFTVDQKRLVSFDYFTITDPGTFAGVFLTDALGNDIAPGIFSMEPGEYTITAFCGYTDLLVLDGDGTITNRFILTLQQIPAPSAFAFVGAAGLLGRWRRRP